MIFAANANANANAVRAPAAAARLARKPEIPETPEFRA